MQALSSRPEPPQILNGWKEIANHLKMSVRTVQRYEHHLRLPVRRPAGKPRASVIATKAELDGWLQASPIREVFRLSGTDFEKQFRSSTISLKHAVAEMTWLRDQMHELRADMTKSVQVLKKSIYELHGGLSRSEPPRFEN
jgi:hypothetical protein